jgi:hypothetical protein
VLEVCPPTPATKPWTKISWHSKSVPCNQKHADAISSSVTWVRFRGAPVTFACASLMASGSADLPSLEIWPPGICTGTSPSVLSAHRSVSARLSAAQPDGTAWDAQPQPQRTTYMCALKRPDQGLDGRTRSLNYRSEAGSSNRQLRYRDRQRTDYVGQGQVEEFKSRRMFGGRAHPCLAGSHSRRRPLGPHKVAREPSAVRQTAKSPHTRWQRPVLAQHDDCAG